MLTAVLTLMESDGRRLLDAVLVLVSRAQALWGFWNPRYLSDGKLSGMHTCFTSKDVRDSYQARTALYYIWQVFCKAYCIYCLLQLLFQVRWSGGPDLHCAGSWYTEHYTLQTCVVHTVVSGIRFLIVQQESDRPTAHKGYLAHVLPGTFSLRTRLLFIIKDFKESLLCILSISKAPWQAESVFWAVRSRLRQFAKDRALQDLLTTVNLARVSASTRSKIS